MDLIIAAAYVLGVYILLPMYFWGRWERGELRRDPVRRRGIARIERELARRERGLIDADDASGVQDRDR
jgi:hypothetical protein